MPKLPEVSSMVAVLFTLTRGKETSCEYFEQILFAFLQYQYLKKKIGHFTRNIERIPIFPKIFLVTTLVTTLRGDMTRETGRQWDVTLANV